MRLEKVSQASQRLHGLPRNKAKHKTGTATGVSVIYLFIYLLDYSVGFRRSFVLRKKKQKDVVFIFMRLKIGFIQIKT